MAIINAYVGQPYSLQTFVAYNLTQGLGYQGTATEYVIVYNDIDGVSPLFGAVDYFKGFNFSYVSATDPTPVSGTITEYQAFFDEVLVFSATELSLSAVALAQAAATIGTADEQELLRAQLSGNDIITGSSGQDLIEGFGGNDILNGGIDALADTLIGGLGNDIYIINTAADNITELAGQGTADRARASVSFKLAAGDNIEFLETFTPTAATTINLTGNEIAQRITGNAGANVLSGLGGNDTLFGGAGNDSLLGGAGNDALSGGLGNDLLRGGAGRDYLNGGAGADRFDFDSIFETGKLASTRDIIQDFTHSTTLALSDHIDLLTIDANGALAGSAAFSWRGAQAFTGVAGQLHYRFENLAGTINDKTIIEGDVNGDKIADFQIQLTGLKSLVGADFIL